MKLGLGDRGYNRDQVNHGKKSKISDPSVGYFDIGTFVGCAF